MKAKELRLGNCCKEITHSKNGVVKVSKRHFENIEDNEIDLFPIPLTEEWLLKFGFIKDKVGEEYYKEDFIIYLPYFFQYKDSVLDPLNHAHQLQNLYFALTNKELKQ